MGKRTLREGGETKLAGEKKLEKRGLSLFQLHAGNRRGQGIFTSVLPGMGRNLPPVAQERNRGSGCKRAEAARFSARKTLPRF